MRNTDIQENSAWRFGALVLLLTGVALVASHTARAEEQEHEYVGARKCKSCHAKDAIGNQYEVWLESSHAKALDTLATDQAKEWATERGIADPQTDERCVKCHITAHGVSEDFLGTRYSQEEGVSCEACHGAGRDYRKKAVMIDLEMAESKGLIAQTEQVCLKCHNDESPAWNPERYTLSDGTTAGFDYVQAVKAIAHPVPEGYDPLAEGAD